MNFVVLVVTDGDGASATWTSTGRHFSDGTKAEGLTPQRALRNLARALDEADRRQAVVNAIHSEEDD